MKINYKKEILNIALTVIASILSAFGLYVFVYPASFAPSGVDGVATMLQKLSGVSAGIYSLIFNIPLLIIAWFVLKRKYVVYTIIFTILSSFLIILLQKLSFYQYVTTTERLIPAIFSGIILGVRTGVMLRIGASTGGVDVIAGMIQKRNSHRNIERVISIICYVIIGLSYFVYRNIDSILLSIVQMFVFEKAASVIMKDTRNAVEFKIVTKNPMALKEDIINNLKHGATVLDCRGMYTDNEGVIILSVVNNRQIPEFLNIIKKYPDTFVYYSDVTGVNGNFRWFKDDEVK